ncbi:MAG: hypothetical protein R3B41_01180 [Candidatus Doudnabacteria bacterium]
MNYQNLLEYFRSTKKGDKLIGMEVETSFVNQDGFPITKKCSQKILKNLPWEIQTIRGELITELKLPDGSKLSYELGRQNLELSLSPYPISKVIAKGREFLEQIYSTANQFGAEPWFSPILKTDEDLLVIPDERDATWLKLDGRPALNLLARCSSVQFTIGTSYQKAVGQLNSLLNALPEFLVNYPQDKLWKQYIKSSKAAYLPKRYGGPRSFISMVDYGIQLTKHKVIYKDQLVDWDQLDEFDIDQFLRSVWWYFRLRRYQDQLCIEVRPLPRTSDCELKNQLAQVLEYCG